MTLTRRGFVAGTLGAVAAAPFARLPIGEYCRRVAQVSIQAGVSVPPRWNRAARVDMGWGYPYFDNRVEASMMDSAVTLAIHYGWESDGMPDEESLGGWLAFPSDDDLVRALSVPIPMAIVYYNLCAGMMVRVPDEVQQAFDRLKPMYFPGR